MRRLLAVLVLLCMIFAATPARGATTRHAVTIVLVRDAALTQTTLSDAALVASGPALRQYLNHDVAGAWPLPVFAVTTALTTTEVPTASNTTWLVYLRPYSTVFNAVGWHSVDTHGNPTGEVGVAQAKDSYLPWVTVISHELSEMAVDPYASSAAISYSIMTGYETTITARVYALEVCDPVVNNWYALRSGGRIYMMADFVYPSYFNDKARFPFDKGHHARAPFTPVGQGYQSSLSATGYAWGVD